MCRELQTYLDTHHVPYEVLTHPIAYTAQEVAHAQHIPGREIAKVVIVKTEEGAPLMLVLPATHTVDFARLQAVLGTRAELEDERAFRDLFPDCKTGAEPPFGNLFGLNTLVDTALAHDERIVFNAGSHWQTVRLRYADFVSLVQPRIAAFARPLKTAV
jgi:Ala-tRNA(Pro) deacylase